MAPNNDGNIAELQWVLSATKLIVMNNQPAHLSNIGPFSDMSILCTIIVSWKKN